LHGVVARLARSKFGMGRRRYKGVRLGVSAQLPCLPDHATVRMLPFLLLVLPALGACDKKPTSPPPPKAVAQEGPTAASGGPPSADFPAGIKPAPSGDKVAAAASHKGPAEGGTAVGGMSSGQAATTGNPGAAAPTAGDGKAEPK